MERRTRKILAMNGCLHIRSNVARLISIEECVRRERKSYHGYLRENTKGMLQAALKEKVAVKEESLQDCEKKKKEYKVKNWKEKAPHGEFVHKISEEAKEKSWRWLRNGFLKNGDRRFDSGGSGTSF